MINNSFTPESGRYRTWLHGPTVTQSRPLFVGVCGTGAGWVLRLPVRGWSTALTHRAVVPPAS